MSEPPAIEVRSLCKSYVPGVPVLRDFDFALQRGEIHALIGSNGAGKSTFARILSGLTRPNRGELRLHGKPYTPDSKQAAARAGVVMVLQELNIIPTLSVAENLFLHRLPHSLGVVRREELAREASAALGRVGLGEIDPEDSAGSLGVGQQQLVEIAAALAQESSVLILDEPTAALTGPETGRLFENLCRLRDDGVSIIYISHRMNEISEIAGAVTVMRDGRRVATHATEEVSESQWIREMAGVEIAERKPRPPRDEEATTGLTVRNLHSGSEVKGVSFEARRGEILGIAGLIGAGRTETLRAIFGARGIDSGDLSLGPEQEPFHPASPSDAVKAGIALIPEDRKHDGLLLERSIALNTSLGVVPEFSRFGILDHGEEDAAVTRVCDRLEVKRDSLEQNAGQLSGGNQQKIVIARWLLRQCDVLLFDEPTRGIDIASREAIYRILDQLAEDGKTIVVVSSDLLELMGIAHRIIVMSNGVVTGEFLPETWTQEAITRAAFQGFAKTTENGNAA